MQSALRKERIAAAVAAVLLEGALLYALVIGLWIQVRPDAREDSLTLFDIRAPEPAVPPPPPPLPEAMTAEEPGDAPVHGQATPIAVPEPAVVLPPIQAINAAPAPSTGNAASTGRTETPSAVGSDQGAPARRVQGALSGLDYPRWASQKVGGVVVVLYSVETDGRVGTCEIAGSSGSRRLDNYTCSLVRKRYRFEPMRDRSGKPARTFVRDTYTWVPWKPPAAEEQ